MFRSICRSISFISPDARPVLGMIVLALLVSALGVVEPLITKFIFDELSSSPTFSLLLYGIAGLFLVELARSVFSGMSSVLLWNVRVRTDFRLREKVIGKLCSLPLAYHREQRVGTIINKVNQSISSFLNTFNELAANMLPSFVYLGLSLTAMFRLDSHLTVVVLIFLPLPTIIGAWAAREQAQRERELMEKWSLLYGRLNEMLMGILTVKGFAQEHTELGRFLNGSEEANAIVRDGIRRDTLTSGARNFAATLARITAIGYGGYLVSHGEMTLGTLVAFLGFIGGLFGPVQGLTGAYQTTRRGIVALEVIFGILDSDDEIHDSPGVREAGPLSGAVTFSRTCFGYKNGPQVIHDFDLDVTPGETIALVGPSGSGKTTLINLLQRQYDVTSGSIFIDGTDLRSLSVTSLRKQMGIVFQDVHLFYDTVYTNIAYGRPDASREEVIAAAKAANAHDFIMDLPEGYETLLGERGNRLSGGQKQRLAIARALLVNPPILILDEATSALDVESEAVVQQALRNLIQGRTTFIIAHRLSTVAQADRIVVLRDGHIEAIGSHDELMAAGGYYARLVQLQSEGFFPTELNPLLLAA